MSILNEKLSVKHKEARKDVYGAIQENNEILRKLANFYYKATGKDLDSYLFKDGKLIKDSYPSDGILPARTAINNFKKLYDDYHEHKYKYDSKLFPSDIILSFNIGANYRPYNKEYRISVAEAFEYLKEIQSEIQTLSYLRNTKKNLDSQGYSYSYKEIAKFPDEHYYEHPGYTREKLAKASQLKDYEGTFKKSTIKEEILEIYNKCFNY